MQNLFGQLESFLAILAVIAGFSFLIFVHELGHYLVAKWVGIKVTQFAIGFGPSLLAWRKGIGLRWGSTESEYEKRLAEGASPDDMGETEYRLNGVPLGGYVKMQGQEDLNPEAALCDDERSFSAKPVWMRACVISAGVVMNLIFGVIFFVIAFMAGVELSPAMVGKVVPGSPAAVTFATGHTGNDRYRGLKTGDRITHIDGKAMFDFSEIAVSAALAGRDQQLQLTVDRVGESSPLVYPVTPRKEHTTNMLTIGVGRPISLTLAEHVLGDALPKVLSQAGVKPGMRVVRVNGRAVEHYGQFEEAVAAAEGLPVTVSFANAAAEQMIDVSLSAVPTVTASPDGRQLHVFGMVPAIKVPGVIPDSPAAQAGLVGGDMIAKIGPISWPTWDEVVQMVEHAAGQPIQVTVRRDDQLIQLPPITPGYNGKIGILYGLALDETIVTRVLPSCPLAKLNLNPGSQILTVNGQPVGSFGDIQRLLLQVIASTPPDRHAQGDTDTAHTVAIGFQPHIANTPPSQARIQIDADWQQQITRAGWDQPLTSTAFNLMVTPMAADNPFTAAWLGIRKSRIVMLQTYVTLLRLFQGTVPASQMRGPLGIADAGTTFAKEGYAYLFFFLGLISVNLVVINFLPIPIVDGGLMVFLLIEKLKGSPVSVRIQTAATVVGLAIIGSVLLFTLFYDAKRLFDL